MSNPGRKFVSGRCCRSRGPATRSPDAVKTTGDQRERLAVRQEPIAIPSGETMTSGSLNGSFSGVTPFSWYLGPRDARNTR